MNINKKRLLVFLMTLIFCQFQLSSLKAEDVKSIDDEELPAIDPFAGGTAGSTNQVIKSDNQVSLNSSLLNNMRLVGTITSQKKNIVIFLAPDGGAYKYEENEYITDTTMILEIFNDVVIVRDENDNKFEVYMNNIIKPSEG